MIKNNKLPTFLPDLPMILKVALVPDDADENVRVCMCLQLANPGLHGIKGGLRKLRGFNHINIISISSSHALCDAFEFLSIF